jgi:hypothetical protein
MTTYDSEWAKTLNVRSGMQGVRQVAIDAVWSAMRFKAG